MTTTSTGGPSLEQARAERGGLPFWLGIPVRLRRFPGALAAVFGATLVLAVATAAGPLFLSSAGSAALARRLTGARQAPALTVVGFGPLTPTFVGPADRALRSTGGGIPQLVPPVLSVVTDVDALAAGPAGTATATHLIGRTGFLDHVRVIGSATGAGVWLSGADAAALGVRPGDLLRFRSGSGTATATVAGTFEAFTSRPLEPYWAPLASFLTGAPGAPAPPVLLAEPGIVTTLGSALEATGRLQWDFGLAPGRLSPAQGQALAAALVRVRQDADDERTALGGAFQPARFHTSAPQVQSTIPALVGQAGQAVDAMRGPVEAIALAGRILALLGVAAAGIYGVRRRRVEAALITSRGINPAVQGALATAEALLPAAAGTVAGWAVAVALARTLGPSGFVVAQAGRDALVAVAASAAVGLALLGVAAGAAARLEFEEVAGRLPGLASRVPWEAIVLLLGAAAFYELATRGSALVAGGDAPHLDRLLLLFPLLFMAGLAGLAVRGLRRLLGRTRGGSRGLGSPAHLALRRLASAPRLAMLLITAASLAVGILVESAMVSASVEATSRIKALVGTGGDVAVPLAAGAQPPAIGQPVTVVGRVADASNGPGGPPVDVLVVDPSTFARAAFWDPSFSDRPLPELLSELSRPGPRLPAVAAGPTLTVRSTIRISDTTLAVSVVGKARAFPTMRPGRPMIIVARSTLKALAPEALARSDQDRTLLARGDDAAILGALRRAGVPTAGARTPQALRETPAFQAVAWTFDFLKALGILSGLVALIGLVLYLQSRQQAREVAYAISRRMGLSRAAYRRSVAFELGGMLLGAFVIGTGLAAAATALVYRKLDLLPSLPPAPLFRIPMGTLGEVALAAVATAAIGAVVVQRQAQRANVAEVLRLA